MHLLRSIRLERIFEKVFDILACALATPNMRFEFFCCFHLSVVMEDGLSLPLDDQIIDASHATTTWKERALFGPGAWRDLGYYDRFDIRVPWIWIWIWMEARARTALEDRQRHDLRFFFCI